MLGLFGKKEFLINQLLIGYKIMNKNKIKLILPHNIISKSVQPKNLDKVVKIGAEIERICKERIGIYHNGALAITHSQVTKKKPRRIIIWKNVKDFST